ncbi:cyclin-domain-containing protein [Suillus subalutaceus]|uniref:cyclin-domain-containing protein n=1 Tax=Suillus subalutaceus TaxID=48586 RepID=UPI001B86FAE0|nr:cyclin-domain-containing protein [Suillus subalutaceus]KAG1836736.1 cyclin-domain-containing protein [Suillus subalutaceus]KAG1890359.1 cyclin-domain-containing protein [Suillus subluteus]
MHSSTRVTLPAAFEVAEIDNLALLIANMLERLIAHNDKIPLLPESLTRFHSRTVPNISVLDYLRRIIKWTKVEKACLLLTLHYVDQICARMPLFTLSSLTCHRFIIASITVCSKGLCDSFCTNALYARVGGIPVPELNVLEREFLLAIDWRLMCTREVLQEYYINLIRTDSSGRFALESEVEDSDMDTSSVSSRSASPMDTQVRHGPSFSLLGTRESSSVMGDTSTLPTIEQNMAFAALQHSLKKPP